jgi:XRE family transcriptional regulator, master regulator for biofilm formation
VPQPTAVQLGAAIRRLRERRGWSIEKLAQEAGPHWTTVSRIENGTYNPSWDIISKLAAALEVDTADLVRLAAEQLGD